jgi:hypothetical protein
MWNSGYKFSEESAVFILRAEGTFKASTFQTTRHYIQNYCNFNTYHHEKIKFHSLFNISDGWGKLQCVVGKDSGKGFSLIVTKSIYLYYLFYILSHMKSKETKNGDAKLWTTKYIRHLLRSYSFLAQWKFWKCNICKQNYQPMLECRYEVHYHTYSCTINNTLLFWCQ